RWSRRDDGGGATTAWEGGDDKKWRRTKPTAGDASDDEVQKLQVVLGALAGLRASSIASTEAAEPAKFGLDQPRLVITLEQKSEKNVLKIGADANDKKCEGSYALVDGAIYVYVLSKADVACARVSW